MNTPDGGNAQTRGRSGQNVRIDAMDMAARAAGELHEIGRRLGATQRIEQNFGQMKAQLQQLAIYVHGHLVNWISAVESKTGELEQVLEAETNRLDDAIDASGTSRGGSRERDRQPMVSRRGFDTVPMLSGEIQGFNDWSFNFKGFIRLEPKFEDYVVGIEELNSAPTLVKMRQLSADIGPQAEWFDEQLFMMLVNRSLEGSKAMSVVRNCESCAGCKGALSWHRIASECKGNKGEMRMDALRDAARKPPQCTFDAEIVSKISDWESAVRLFAKEFPDEVISEYEKSNI